MSLHARLLVVGGEVKASEIKLRLPCTIGRGRGCTIVLAHPLVSRQHCELFEAEGRLMVRDLGSLNGTFVNNQRIGDTAPLPPNELLTIGTVTFRAVYDDVTSDESDLDEAAMKDSAAGTVYAGRAPGGSGTEPLPMDFKGLADLAGIEPAAASPLSESLAAAVKPLPKPPASLVPQPEEPQAAELPAEKAEAPEEETAKESPEKEAAANESAAGASDEDLQDFLKSLGGK